ncbi:CEI_1a_G0038550.mRNA.1.CDS.1 [Saccharomyces cerevisiae]|nr:CEI_1a_G0038550.mRNA.1.CDS.1 [Saccharomyces cerevisiae]CAI7434151.1 CEI_1a_G0038550.mRNA.1.CDS.1 [Saccharomyces cerevisiae]
MSFNLYLYENKACNAEYFFFNAAHCPEAFRTTLLEPFCFNEDKMLRSSLLKILSLFIEEALQVYFTEVDKLWNLIHTE